MAVIAEGIESAAQFALVRELGCDLGQGYHMPRPLGAPEATKLVAGEVARSAAPESVTAPMRLMLVR
jgi:EAL domain-containing protein (putative c-di-GMP-specific phosphodiesterase class I)